MEWTALLVLLIGGLISWFLRPFTDSYIREKAKNLATKEDIGEITRKVEEIKGDVITGIELLKWDLGKKSTVHRLAAEYQFKALAEIGASLYKLNLATRSLRPIIDSVDFNTPVMARHQKRYEEWSVVYQAFAECIERHRLFLPETVYIKLQAIRKVSITEAMSFSMAASEERMKLTDFQEAINNIEELEKEINGAISAIQNNEGVRSFV